jgi:hypothetical protein
VKSAKRKSKPPVMTVAERIDQLADPAFIASEARGSSIFDEHEAAIESLAKWEAADPRGMPTEIALRDSQVAIAKEELAAAEVKFKTMRGDFVDAGTSALPPSAAIADSPTSLTTSDVAHAFAGLHWPTETAWKKPLADKPKWLSACVVIPGSRGLSETRWNPVLIGDALVGRGLVKANRVRARFQTVERLKPWLDAWKTHEADSFDET